MKLFIRCLLLSLALQCIHSSRLQAATGTYALDLHYQVAGIDSLDTIFFDLRNVQLSGGAFEFPVYFKSNDSIVAMDFSFKYNQASLIYDTITGLQSYVSFLSNYTSVDSTVYFTSFSMANAYQNNTHLVRVKFFPLNGQSTMVLQDIKSALGYLNGDPCPLKVLVPSVTGLGELPAGQFKVYPNPAAEVIRLEVKETVLVSITDMHGRLLRMPFSCTPEMVTTLQVGDLPEGIYFISLLGSSGRNAQSRFVVKQ